MTAPDEPTAPAAPADTAGTPWAGRTLPAGGFSGDAGESDAALVAALAAARGGLAAEHVVVDALAAARVFVPVVAVLGEGAEAAHGTADKQADMALVTLTGADGRRALPVFTGLAALAAWDPAARPVPVEARRAAVSAVAEGCDLMVLDPAGPTTYVVSRPAMWAVGAGRPWLPAHLDPEVLAELAGAVADRPDVVDVRADPGRGAELAVTLVVRPGLVADQVQQLAREVGAALQASELLRERVDGLELALTSA